MVKVMVGLYDCVRKKKCTPNRRREGVVVDLLKKRDETEPGNYRDITLLNAFLKYGLQTTE